MRAKPAEFSSSASIPVSNVYKRDVKLIFYTLSGKTFASY
jgi:hypothetical protein